MTRFWITLDQAVVFVVKAFARMHGGEIFVPKIPSVRITDLAKAMGPKMKQKIIGIRPGEKLHEKMCSTHEAHLTLDFKDYYLIMPSIKFTDRSIDYKKNKIGEKGNYVNPDFEYSSDKNDQFLNLQDIININKKIGIHLNN